MNSTFFKVAPLILAVFFSACNSNRIGKTPQNIIEEMPVIGKYVSDGDNNEVMVVDYIPQNDIIYYNIDDMLESVEFIQLDSPNDNALVGESLEYEMSENYYAGRSGEQVKLFYKDGSYIGDVGRKGQGPDEYLAVYDIAIDEKNNRIYLLEMGTVNHILSYDLKCNFVKRIPLPYTLRKGRMTVKDGEITVMAMKFTYEETPAVWKQDTLGNVLSVVDTEVTSVYPDFSNEILLSSLSDGSLQSLDILRYSPVADSIYSLKPGLELVPVFTVNYGEIDRIPRHFYTEFPHFFIATIYSNETLIKNGIEILHPWFTLYVDKESGKGSFIQPVFESLGGLLYKGRFFGSNDYLVYSVEPGELEDLIHESINAYPNLTLDRLEKLKSLTDNIDMDGNNILIYGKLKK